MQSLARHALWALTLATAHASPLLNRADDTCTATTAQGDIIGHTATNNTDVWEYLGVPFAAPPINKLRFMPPQAYQGHGTYTASKYSGTCPQHPLFGTGGINAYPYVDRVQWGVSGKAIVDLFGETGDPISEDCLTLNIWTPKDMSGPPKAVMLWIYGGGFFWGGSRNPAYNGAYLAEEQDVIVVSVNYRLNVFGFPGAPGKRNNLGLLDQRAGVVWTHKNIAAFGGDPNRIIMFGQSAGGASMDLYSFAYYNDPAGVYGQIQHSGSVAAVAAAGSSSVPGASGGSSAGGSSSSNWLQLAADVGCTMPTPSAPFPTDDSIFACMQSLPMDKILAATNGGSLTQPGVSQSSFNIAVDEISVFSDYSARAAAKKFLQVPMMIGNTDYEAGVASPLTVAQVGSGLPDATAYSLLESATNTGFSCPAAQRVIWNLKAKLPTWRYRWMGFPANLVISTKPYSGAYHGVELGTIFDTANINYPDTADDAANGAYYRGAWAAFAKDPVNGLNNYGWKQFVPNTTTLIQPLLNNASGPNYGDPTKYDNNCSLVY